GCSTRGEPSALTPANTVWSSSAPACCAVTMYHWNPKVPAVFTNMPADSGSGGPAESRQKATVWPSSEVRRRSHHDESPAVPTRVGVWRSLVRRSGLLLMYTRYVHPLAEGTFQVRNVWPLRWIALIPVTIVASAAVAQMAAMGSNSSSRSRRIT